MTKRGRPKRDPIDVMRTKAWYLAVELALRVKTAHAVEVRVEADNLTKHEAKFAGARRWASYRDGTRVPLDIPGELNPIDMANKLADGTNRWFRSPLWMALKGQFADHHDVSASLLELQPVASLIFSNEDWGRLDEEDFEKYTSGGIKQLATNRAILPEKIVECENLESIDLLESVVLLLEYGRLSGSWSITRRSLDLYAAASRKIALIPEIRIIMPRILEVIEDRFAPILDCPIDEMFPPWHVRMPELVERVYDIDAMKAAALVAAFPADR